jgi:hypothetical protein
MRRTYPKTVTVIAAVIVLLVALDVVLVVRWLRYRDETTRLRAGMTDAERQRADMVVESEQNKVGVMLELIRRQAQGDREMHLSISIDSGRMTLERDGALLREMPVEIGKERVVGVAPDTLRIVPPLGARSVERMLGAKEAWEAPAWVYADRGLPVPAERRTPGSLGRNAILLTGGTLIYALPDSGVLADSSYVLPGAIRVKRSDLRAIAPNLGPGVKVYFYD